MIFKALTYNHLMCGRLVLESTTELEEYLGLFAQPINKRGDWNPSWNIAPRQELYALTNRNELNTFMFGFIPVFDKKKLWFNTRDDTLLSGKGYWQRFRNNRCIILTNGFYEWKGSKAPKTPYYIQVKGEEIFAFAGLWHSFEEEGIESRMATIITTSPNGFMEPIHNRMPVILNNKSAKAWLSPEKMELEEIGNFFKAYPANEMKAHTVSTQVGPVQNNGPELIEPIP